MTQSHQVAILLPLIVGATAVAGTIVTRALAVTATINFFRRQQRLGRTRAGFWIDLSIVALAVSIAFIAHLIEIGVWAFLLVICGDSRNLHSLTITQPATIRRWVLAI
jgi:hypothetical protein